MNNLYNSITAEISPVTIVLNIIFSLILLLGMVWVYKKTHKGLSYSPSFIFTLVIVGILGTVIMMVVQNSLVGAIVLLGAFSMIRFRTILKETRDIAFVFFALVIGISVGTNNYAIVLIATVMISLIILLLDRYNVGSLVGGLGMILTFNAKNDFDIGAVKTALLQYSDSFELLQVRTAGVDINSYAFSIKPKKDLDSVQIIKILKNHPAITDIEIITGEHGVEY